MSTNFAEQWLSNYKQTTNPVSYQAFDFEGIKRSLIEYLQIYHPEYFNNLIETDELLPLLEMFAYVGDLFAYRADINTQEHILTNATRKSSVLQLAEMLGYTPSRRVPATGLVKIMSVETSENIVDSAGQNLRGVRIKWNDPTNPNWQTQFTRIVNRVLNSQIGTLSSRDRVDILGVQFERYGMNINDQVDGVYRYTINVNGQSHQMELVTAELSTNSVKEQPPQGSRPLSVLFSNDGFGNGSRGTGFFFLTKQGALTSQPLTFDGKTINVTVDLPVTGVNETDVWLAQVDEQNNVIAYWTQVKNIAYNDADTRNVYQVETEENDRIRLVFGDGTFAAIPNGRFLVWTRVSDQIDATIQPNVINNKSVSFEYFDSTGNVQTVKFELSLQVPISNSSSSESIEQIKNAAPGVFYTQDRMVNGRDYQVFLLQDPSIIKTRAVNRTFAGQSKYSGWFEGSEVYENVKIFGNDGTIFIEPAIRTDEVPNPNNIIGTNAFIGQYIEPLLSYPDVWLAISLNIPELVVRKFFTPTEKQQIASLVDLNGLPFGATVYLRYQSIGSSFSWVASNTGTEFDIRIRRMENVIAGWVIQTNTAKTVIHSPTTKFWDYRVNQQIDYDTRIPTKDRLTILSANSNNTRTGLLGQDIAMSVVGNYIVNPNLPNQGEPMLNFVEVVGADIDGDRFPEDFTSNALVGKIIRYPVSPTGEVVFAPQDRFPYSSPASGSVGDIIKITTIAGVELSLSASLLTVDNGIATGVTNLPITGQDVIVHFRQYVYLDSSTLRPLPDTIATKQQFAQLSSSVVRRVGRSGLNFLWQHFSQVFDLVDPAKTNIIDIYLITRQYYSSMLNWVSNPQATADDIPPTLDYRQLQLAYSRYLEKGMISDEIILRPGRFKVIFGPKSRPEYRAKIQLVVQSSLASQQSVKADVVRLVRQYFDISNQDFGQTLFFSDLSRYISTNSQFAISSVLLVPLFPGFAFGDLYQLRPAQDEMFLPDISVADIEIVENITSLNIRQQT